MSGYLLVTWFHSILRWLVLAALIWGCVRFTGGWLRGRPFADAERRLLKATVGLLDLQLLLGLLLYSWLSPVTALAFADFGAAMRTTQLRFFAVEHASLMLVAVAAAHVTSVLTRRAPPERQQRKAAIGLGIALLLVLVAIPWPFLPYGRPLLRGFG